MLRIKIPHGRITAEHLDTFAYIADNYSRGWGHLTTRQNVQFHFIPLEQTPEILRLMASVGLTSREACGDTVRNVMGCHLAGACPQEILDITPWAQATTDFLLRHPYGQRLPRKFKINFSGCATDCGQAMFNDVGVIAATRGNLEQQNLLGQLAIQFGERTTRRSEAFFNASSSSGVNWAPSEIRLVSRHIFGRSGPRSRNS